MQNQNFLLPYHFSYTLKSFFSFLTAATIILMFTTFAYSAEVTLQWDANTEPDLTGYKVYYDTDTGVPYSGSGATEGSSPIIVPVGNLPDANNPEFTLSGLDGSQDYYFSVTAYDNETPALESDYSNEVTSPGGSISTYTLTSSAGTNGTISPSGSTSVNHGGSQTFTITPATGYSVADVIVDGSSAGAVSTR